MFKQIGKSSRNLSITIREKGATFNGEGKGSEIRLMGHSGQLVVSVGQVAYWKYYKVNGKYENLGRAKKVFDIRPLRIHEATR